MVFNSIDYLIFFTAVFLLHWVIPLRWRWALLLPASLFFYGYWKWQYLFLLLFTTMIDYCCCLGIATFKESAAQRRTLVGISILSNLSILAFFKYANFFITSVGHLPPVHQFVLPIGISFYVFQAMSYTIDVYRGTVPAEKNPFYFVLFITFFPQLVAGPIERPGNLLPQLKAGGRFNPEKFAVGFQLMLWGFMKKVVIADRCAVYVDQIFNNIPGYEGQAILVGMYLFAIQIYCDFSGYSDIARGCAKMLGFDLMLNFNRPYFAENIVEFWRRWHISLSTWLKDYLYIPLGGNRKGKVRTYVNLLITMVLGGLWHGANWTFILWGFYHGVLLALSKLKTAALERLHIPSIPGLRLVGILITFHLVLFSWLIFRVKDMADLKLAIHKLLAFQGPFQMNPSIFFNFGIGLAILLLVEILQEFKLDVSGIFKKSPIYAKFAYAYAFIFLIILFGVEKGAQFIYFQF